MKQLACLKQYVLGRRLNTVITMTNNLTDMTYNDNFYLDPRALDRLAIREMLCF